MSGLFSPAPPINYRPLSMSILGWYLFVSGALGGLFLLVPVFSSELREAMDPFGLGFTLMMILNVISAVVQGAAGIGILQGHDWARKLILGYLALNGVLVALVMASFNWLFPAIVIITLGVYGYLLTTPAANGFFDGSILEEPEEKAKLRRFRRGDGNPSDLARILGAIIGVAFWPIVAPMAFLVVAIARIGSAPSLLVIALILIGVPCVGLVLWGQRRWRAYFGWSLVGIGAYAVFGVVALLGVTSMGLELPNIDPDLLEEVMPAMARAAGIAGLSGLVGLGLGSLMLRSQWAFDRQAAELMDDPEFDG